MGDYKAPDNVYWLFSSAAQAIAAFIGFLAAGFFFTYDKIDKYIERDETLTDIYEDIKKQFYKRLRILFLLTGFSIILSLLAVYLNGFDTGAFGLIIKLIVAILDILTIIWAIYFVLFIIDPSKVDSTAKKLIKENEEFFKDVFGQTLTRGDFIEKFINLEKILRSFAEKYQITLPDNSRFRNFLPLNEIIKQLFQREAISKIQFSQLLELNKIRNLAVHGEMQQIEKKQGDQIDELIKELEIKIDM